MSFTINGCRITVSFYFVALLAVVLIYDPAGVAFAGILAAALHEAGHLVVMRIFRVKPSLIRFTPFGIDLVKSDCVVHSYWHDALISLAGPGVNIAVALLLQLFSIKAEDPFLASNIALALFNLLPVEPLDGGQALYSVLCTKFSAEQAAKAVSILSFLTLMPLAAAGFLVLFRSPWNFTLLLTCAYLMVLLVLKPGKFY
jgi:stage IV sporulation protein FB